MQEQTAFMVVSWTYMVLTLLMVLNRLYIRTLRRGPLSNWSDALVVAAWIFVLFQTICDHVMYSEGAMIRWSAVTELTPELSAKMTIFKKIFYVEDIIYYIPLYCVKAAILCFLLEITPAALWKIRWSIWIGLGLCATGMLYTSFAFAFSCWPVDPWWTSNGDDYDGCIAGNATYPLVYCYHMFTDVYIYCIPFVLMTKISKKIPRSQKLATYFMFGAGFILACFAIPQVVSAFVESLYDPVMWNFWLSIHEESFALTVACLPSLRASWLMWQHGGDIASGRASMARRIRRGELETKEVAGVGSQEALATEESYESKSVGVSTMETVVELVERWDTREPIPTSTKSNFSAKTDILP